MSKLISHSNSPSTHLLISIPLGACYIIDAQGNWVKKRGKEPEKLELERQSEETPEAPKEQ